MPTISNQYSCKQNPGVAFWWVLCENGGSWPVPRTHSQDLHESSDCHGEYYLYQSGSGKHSPLRIMDGGTFIKNQQLPYTVIRWKESVETLLGLLRDEKPIWPATERRGWREMRSYCLCSYCLCSLQPASGKGLGQLWICSWGKEQTWNREERNNWD